MADQTIKIFLASSIELKEDRDEFRKFISGQNDRLQKQGIYLEIIQWENFLDATKLFVSVILRFVFSLQKLENIRPKNSIRLTRFLRIRANQKSGPILKTPRLISDHLLRK